MKDTTLPILWTTQTPMVVNDDGNGCLDTEAINVALRVHQETTGDWNFREAAESMHLWADRMILQFNLQVSTPALTIEQLRRAYGHYRLGRNGFGINDEIAINVSHLQGSPYWRVLGTLLHELLHEWQEHRGKTRSRSTFNYHNKEYRDKAASLGLMVSSRGVTSYVFGDTPFMQLLQLYGVDTCLVPKDKDPLPLVLPKSKLHLYMCPCKVRVRVGRSRFNARCLDCGGLFELVNIT